MLATFSRTVCCRLLAAFIVALVLSPYSEPFATMNGTDFGSSGAVDLAGSSTPKAPTHDALPPPPSAVVDIDGFPIDLRPIVRAAAAEWRPGQRTILRL